MNLLKRIVKRLDKEFQTTMKFADEYSKSDREHATSLYNEATGISKAIAVILNEFGDELEKLEKRRRGKEECCLAELVKT